MRFEFNSRERRRETLKKCEQLFRAARMCRFSSLKLSLYTTHNNTVCISRSLILIRFLRVCLCYDARARVCVYAYFLYRFYLFFIFTGWKPSASPSREASLVVVVFERRRCRYCLCCSSSWSFLSSRWWWYFRISGSFFRRRIPEEARLRLSSFLSFAADCCWRFWISERRRVLRR